MIFQDQNILSKTQNLFHNFFQVLEVLIFQNFSVTGRPAVDRHSTDMHNFVHVCISRPGLDRDSTAQESLLSGNVSRLTQSTDSSNPGERSTGGRLAVDWPESSALWKLSVDRAGRPVAATVRKMTVGRSTGGRPPALTEPQRLFFWAAYIKGFCHLF